ncbi:NAD(P)H-dependent FMN reductase [Xylanibacillus composti]|uniref:NAD(P)H-dependent FMN reductase n=1 Tax=Xylanibacillus composti TaxID=1572762 RepID=A0A8J4M331_9BACL|nr:NADPH-dependent FMN reductase [Xylanibacillus composti]GIQ69680.1 NAD(P)H-dependent FMN reductase [Xylanibacillus composti]
MSSVVILSGSPTANSRLNAFIQASCEKLAYSGIEVKTVHIAELPAKDLVRADFQSEAIQEKVNWVKEAQAVLIASQVYQASYTGVLKLFLDMLPQKGLHNKIVLPLFVGGSMAHLLAMDYALKPVISALSGRHILAGVYGVDKMIARVDDGFEMDDELHQRLQQALDELLFEMRWREAAAEKQA